MTIDPSTLPDGTLCETKYGDTVFTSHDGTRFAPHRCSVGITSQTIVGGDDDWLVRTFSPDPLPSQEVPRDEWANIKPGSRVQVEHAGGTVIVGEFLWCDKPEIDELRVGSVSQRRGDIARVFVLDEPADPDADLIERVAKRLHDEADPQRLCADGFGPGCGQRAKYIERARSALDVAKAAIAEVSA